MIKAEKIVRKYGTGELEVYALRGIDLEIDDGEFVAIIGPSGAGKSTLLYQLSLLDEPTSGEIHIDNMSTSHLSETVKSNIRLNKLGYVFQDYALLPELTALDNVALPILMQGVSRVQAEEMAKDALEHIGLSDKLHNLPSQMSGGQQQRVAIARAVAHKPHILFADEPTANLDSENGKIVMDTFAHLHRDGQTIVMVTHEDEYASHAHRIIKLKDGEVVSDIRQKPVV